MNLYDHDSEQQVIGAALMGRVEELDSGDFHDHKHREYWQIIQALVVEQRPITLETFIARMGGDMEVAIELTTMISRSSTLSSFEYAHKVRDLAKRRGVMSALEKAAKEIHSGDSVDQLVSHLHANSLTFAREQHGAEKLTASNVVDGFLDAIAEPRDTWGMRCGIGAIDHELGGIHAGEVFMIAGDPGVGKSIFATQLGFQLAGVDFWDHQLLEKHPGAMYHLEMTSQAVIRRIICAKARVDYREVRTGRMAEEEQTRFLAAAETIDAAPVFISDDTDWTTMALRADVARLIVESGIEWVMVDYAGLLKDPAESEIAREVSVSKALHDIAKMGVAMIVVETLNKAGLRGDRGLSGVRGSVQKVYDADVATYLQVPRDDTDPATKMRELKFTKVREGDTFLKVPLVLHGAQKRFEPR